MIDNMLEKAIEVALEAHKGQLDKAGEPYILHPLRLMLKFHGEEERVVAVLHDVVEDSEITLETLKRLGFSDIIVDAVESLTKNEKELYEDFIKRIKNNKLAKKIKIEDIKDNLNLLRLKQLNEKDLSRVKKYHDALNALELPRSNRLDKKKTRP